MVSNILQSQDYDESEIKIPKKRLSHASNFLRQDWNTGSQVVDPTFNELHLEFKYINSNLKALFHSCENYKMSMQSFFYQTMLVTESFRLLLHETASINASDSTDLLAQHQSSAVDFKIRTADILRNFYLTAGMTDMTKNHNRIDIERLNKQICVISKRVENDMMFFQNSVQKPISALIQVCDNITRTINCRQQANLELSGIYDKIIRAQQSTTKTTIASKLATAKKLDRKLAFAKSKYETLNQILKKDLGIFLAVVRAKFMREWFKNFYFTTLRISYSLHYFCWNCPEFKKLKLKECPRNPVMNGYNNNNPGRDTEAILQKFQQDHCCVFQEIEKLGISNSHSRK